MIVGFVHDVLSNGRKFRSLTIVDDYTREAIAIEVDFSLTSERVSRSSRRWPMKTVCRKRSRLTMVEVYEQRDAWLGRMSRCTSSSPLGRCKLAAWRASTAAFATSCSSSTHFRVNHARFAIEDWSLDYNLCRRHTGPARRDAGRVQRASSYHLKLTVSSGLTSGAVSSAFPDCKRSSACVLFRAA